MNVFKLLLMTSICSSVLMATTPSTAPIEQKKPSIFGSLPAAAQVVYVDKGGDDTAGNGTIIYPYLTISHAMATITDSSPSKRYVLKVGPGDYSDSFSLKANVEVVGYSVVGTRLFGTVDLNDASWNNANDNRSGMEDLTMQGTYNFNFQTQSSQAGKLYFYNNRFAGPITFTGYSVNLLNQVDIQNSLVFGGINQNGCTLLLGDVEFTNANTIALTSSPTVQTILIVYSGGTDGTLSATQVNPTDQPINVTLYNFAVAGALTASGPSTTVTSTCGSIAGPTNFSNGATLTFIGAACNPGPRGEVYSFSTAAQTLVTAGQSVTFNPTTNQVHSTSSNVTQTAGDTFTVNLTNAPFTEFYSVNFVGYVNAASTGQLSLNVDGVNVGPATPVLTSAGSTYSIQQIVPLSAGSSHIIKIVQSSSSGTTEVISAGASISIVQVDQGP